MLKKYVVHLQRNKVTGSRSGATLIELLIYMGMLSILLGVLTTVFTSALDLQLESQSVTGVDATARYVIAKMTNEIQNATGVSSPALGQQSISLQLTTSTGSETIVVSSGVLQVTTSAGTNALSGYDAIISNFLVKRLGVSGGLEQSIETSFTVTSKTVRIAGNKQEIKSYHTAISLRRK